MDLEKIKKLVNFLERKNLAECRVEADGIKVWVKKHPPPEAPARLSPPPVPVEWPAPQREAERAELPPATRNGLITIDSPIVGTFYRASSPEASPFVEVGDEVKVGQVLCIIEAMKIMNEIESEYGGRVSEILVENGHPVEFGEALLRLELFV